MESLKRPHINIMLLQIKRFDPASSLVVWILFNTFRSCVESLWKLWQFVLWTFLLYEEIFMISWKFMLIIHVKNFMRERMLLQKDWNCHGLNIDTPFARQCMDVIVLVCWLDVSFHQYVGELLYTRKKHQNGVQRNGVSFLLVYSLDT